MTRDDDTFLSRWSRRKLTAETAVAEPDPAPFAPAEEALAEPEKTDEEILEELGLPDPDSLTAESDFRGFMSKAVPERLRTRALRKLWLTNPVLANLDELLDYGEDFTDAATVIENLQTVYRVGHGMFSKDEPSEAASDQAALSEDTAPEDDPDLADAPGDDDAESNEMALAGDAAEKDYDSHRDTPLSDAAAPQSDEALQPLVEVAASAQPPAPVPARPRRMKFNFN